MVFQMAPREREELEQFQKMSVPLTAAAAVDEEASLGYTRAVKSKELEEAEEMTYIKQKAQVREFHSTKSNLQDILELNFKFFLMVFLLIFRIMVRVTILAK